MIEPLTEAACWDGLTDAVTRYMRGLLGRTQTRRCATSSWSECRRQQPARNANPHREPGEEHSNGSELGGQARTSEEDFTLLR